MQNYTPETCYPAEGRPDVAADLNEEQCNAYSSHHVANASQGNKATRKPQPRPDQLRAAEACYPAEGRPDVAADLEEEQRNAYSAH
jgi:hypothetical protein